MVWAIAFFHRAPVTIQPCCLLLQTTNVNRCLPHATRHTHTHTTHLFPPPPPLSLSLSPVIFPHICTLMSDSLLSSCLPITTAGCQLLSSRPKAIRGASSESLSSTPRVHTQRSVVLILMILLLRLITVVVNCMWSL